VHFEWNEDKNQENIRKHGIDFNDGWEIFEAHYEQRLINGRTMARIAG
jgi:uncharacterized DUF497 family protein